MSRPPKPVVNPFTIVIDKQEKAPYSFDGLRSDSRHNYRPLIVPTEVAHMETGDYSIKGLEELITIERKSLGDLFGSLGKHGRDRFQREHERMELMTIAGGFACVIVEADWPTVIAEPPEMSDLSVQSVRGTVAAWSQRYNVHWEMAGSRALAELFTFDRLKHFWREHERNRSP